MRYLTDQDSAERIVNDRKINAPVTFFCLKNKIRDFRIERKASGVCRCFPFKPSLPEEQDQSVKPF